MNKLLSIFAAVIVLGTLGASAQAVCVHDGFCDRPIKMGVSISNTPSLPFIYTGTAGMRVFLLRNPVHKFILSNNHVLGAVGPDLCPNTADGYPPPMTWSLQPGTLDLGFDPGNNPAYLAGLVFRFIPIDFSPGAQNRVDAAIAYTTTSLASAEILGLGQPNRMVGTPAVGMPITKSGRTTGVTTGTVTALNATVNVSYGTCGTATFVDQVITTAGLGASGDSGSVVLEQGTNTPVGLYFAGSPTSGVMSPILEVYRALWVVVDSDAPATIKSEADLLAQAEKLPVDAEIEAIKPVQDRYEASLLSVPGVVGVGIGRDETGENAVLVVFCEKLTSALQAAVPADVEGVRVRLVESGRFEAH